MQACCEPVAQRDGGLELHIVNLPLPIAEIGICDGENLAFVVRIEEDGVETRSPFGNVVVSEMTPELHLAYGKCAPGVEIQVRDLLPRRITAESAILIPETETYGIKGRKRTESQPGRILAAEPEGMIFGVLQCCRRADAVLRPRLDRQERQKQQDGKSRIHVVVLYWALVQVLQEGRPTP